MKANENPKTFISYCWEDEEHKKWVKRFAEQLLKDGVEAVVDQYDLKPGDRLALFMEQISEADYVLVICTPTYKSKADERMGGVGYESNIITSELVEKNNERKFIPILRKGEFETALPVYMKGKMAIDLRGEGFASSDYKDLIVTLYGENIKPLLGVRPVQNNQLKQERKDDLKPGKNEELQPICILGIVTDKVTMPKMDGTRGCALYKIPFRLSRKPSNNWAQLFIKEWNYPKRFTTMHRPGIASVQGDMIILDGTTIEEVRDVHRDTLLLCVEEASKKELIMIEQEKLQKKNEKALKDSHENNVEAVAREIEF